MKAFKRLSAILSISVVCLLPSLGSAQELAVNAFNDALDQASIQQQKLISTFSDLVVENPRESAEALRQLAVLPDQTLSLLENTRRAVEEIGISGSTAPYSADAIQYQLPVLQQGIVELETAINQELPGGLRQFTQGMRSVAAGLSRVRPAASPLAQEQMARLGAMLLQNANMLEAFGTLDADRFLKSLSEMATVNAVLRLEPSPDSELALFQASGEQLESTYAPLARALMAVLNESAFGARSEEVLSNMLRGDEAFLGGVDGLASLMDGFAIQSPSAQTPLSSFKESVRYLGTLYALQTGQEVGGMEAIRSALAPNASREANRGFMDLASGMPELRNTTPAEMGRLVEFLVTPYAILDNPFMQSRMTRLTGQEAHSPMVQIAIVGGLLGGGDDGEEGGGGLLSGLLASLPIIGPLLQTVLNLLYSLPIVGGLLQGLLGTLL